MAEDFELEPAQQPVSMFCRGWGQCQHPAKAEAQPCCGCADYEPDQPAPVAATNGGKFGYWCEFCHHPDDGKGLFDQLAASAEEIKRLKGIISHNSREYDSVLGQLRAENYRLADPSRDPKVNRLIADLREVVVAQRDRLARICETTARPDGGTKHAADNAIRHVDEWIARTVQKGN
jgi:hypothetical protein